MPLLQTESFITATSETSPNSEMQINCWHEQTEENISVSQADCGAEIKTLLSLVTMWLG